MTKKLDEMASWTNNLTKGSANILIRCDSSSRLGMGHINRCIALAQALFEVDQAPVFACAPKEGNGIIKVHKLGFKVRNITANNLIEDALFTLKLAGDLGVKTLVVDMCNSETIASKKDFLKFLHILADSTLNVVIIEGMNEECISLETPLPVKAVIVPYFGAEAFDYKLFSDCLLLAGEKFFPLRKEFHRFFKIGRRVSEEAINLLVAIGGGEVSGHNSKVLEALNLIGDNKLKVRVLGGLKYAPNFPFSLKNISYTYEMPKFISWADCAVIGSGLTRYETAFLGTPSIVFSTNADHEKMVSNFASTGAVVNGGIISKMLPATMAETMNRVFKSKFTRSKMADAGQKIIDGKGATRLALIFKELP